MMQILAICFDASRPRFSNMLIKAADDKTKDIDALRSLATRSDVSGDLSKKINQEIRLIQSGIKGEGEAAYEMEFHYGASKNWMIIHDLRLELDGRTAQLDHLLINRFLDIYVCESKRFSEGVAINEEGEFAAFYGGKAYGVPSPIEQNRRHMIVLEAVFKSGKVPLPKRIGFSITPSLNSLILVSKTARISRPKKKIDGIDMVIKNDQLKTRIDRDIDSDNNILTAAKIVSPETLEEFARNLAAAHSPITFDWHARFGLPAIVPPKVDQESSLGPSTASSGTQRDAAATSIPSENEGKKSKLICSSCNVPVTYSVAKFCWFNKGRFGGNVYCMDCQKEFQSSK
jgi:hypothetical protein